jgi:hypothetical protein
VPGELLIEVVPSLEDVQPDEWNLLAGSDNPFVEYEFLRALETSESVGQASGWLPCHVLAKEGDTLVGAVPLYLKSHSYGEYIFDWSWANAAEQAGLAYYPKLVAAIPFTPATGRRFLTHGNELDEAVFETLVAGVQEMARRTSSSSVHVLFCTKEEQEALQGLGFLPRLTYQFHWENSGSWSDFDAYLASFRASARRKVRKERREACASGIEIRIVGGEELTGTEIDAMYRFYAATSERKWGRAYLSHEFFTELNRSLRYRSLVSMAYRDGVPVAGALSFQKGAHLYGRHWGCLEHHDKLHFELCYYQLIEYCLENGYSRFEAGAQGQHKVKRGLLPSETYSSHFIYHPGLANAVAAYLPEEAAGNRAEMEHFQQRSPFRGEDA